MTFLEALEDAKERYGLPLLYIFRGKHCGTVINFSVKGKYIQVKWTYPLGSKSNYWRKVFPLEWNNGNDVTTHETDEEWYATEQFKHSITKEVDEL